MVPKLANKADESLKMKKRTLSTFAKSYLHFVKIYSQDYNTFEQFLCFGEYVFGDCLARSGSDAGGLGPAEGPADPEYWPGGDEKDMPAAKSSDQEVSEEENEESTLDPMQNQVLVLTTHTH